MRTVLPCKSFFGILLATLISAMSAAAYTPPLLPTNNTANIFYATNYGLSTASADNAAAISNAITAAAAANVGAGGGTVEITGPGTYMCGPISLKSKVNLQIDGGATLKMLPITNWPGSTTFINGSGLHDVGISGSGILDGNAQFGTNEWWGPANGSPPGNRPNFINFDTSSKRILIQNVTMQNPPTFHMMLKGNNTDITIQGIRINTDGNSPNTDGMDLGSTNILVQNSYISDGDDNIEIGGSSGLVAALMVTNCTFGTGHGVSIGSKIHAGVSNVNVINCSFTGTQNGIRMKSDNDIGGVVENITNLNITMTNVNLPIQIYSYYDTVGTPDRITPQNAAAETVAATNSLTPVWRNIVISNLTLVGGGDIGGIIWSRTELPATNITLSHITLSAPKTFDIYNAQQVSIIDSQFNFTSGKTLTFYNAQTVVSNSSPVGVQPITLDGLTTNSTSILLSLYNTLGSLTNTNVLDVVPSLTTGGTTLTISNDFTLVGSSVLNYVLGTNADTIVVKSNLTFAGTVNFTAGGGFGAGTYLLATYGGSLTWNSPVIGTAPLGFNYALNNTTPGQVKLIVTLNCVQPTANVSGGGTICSNFTIPIQAALTGTQPWSVTWSDGTVQSGVTTSPATRNVSPTVNTNYTVTALSDSTGCPAGTLSGSASVTVNAHPTASVSGGGTICSGSSVGIQAVLTGTQPWTVTWSDGTVQSGVTSSPATRNVSPTVNTNYTVTALSDSTGCASGTLSGSASVTVNAHPTASVSGGGTVCGGSSVGFQAALTGTQPWTVTWSDGVVQSGVTTSPTTRNVSPTANTNYTVTALADATGCSAGTLSGNATVTVNPRPTANISGGGTNCAGFTNTITATLGGSSGPWMITWSDGTNQVVSSSPATRLVSPALTTTYTVTALADSITGCTNTAAGNAKVTVNPLPTAVVSGGGTNCAGFSNSITATLGGSSGPWNLTWSDGTNQVASSSPATRMVSPAVTTIYTVTALMDLSTGCTNAATGSATVSVCTNSPFQILSAQLPNPDQFVLVWASVSNSTYQVQSKDILDGGSWTTNAVITASDATTSWTNTGIATVTQRYYRVVQTQ